MTDDEAPDPREGPVAALRWFLRTDDGSVVFVREVLSSALAVGFVGLLLFAVSGVWPPMVAVTSGSMEPHMYRGDLIFVVDEHRFSPSVAHDRTGIVPERVASRRSVDYRKFGGHGDVVIYDTPERARFGKPPIIHRARFWVAGGENWYAQANGSYVLNAENCAELTYCPAPNSGFITKGDANGNYDQASGLAPPVKPKWIRGKAMLRVPWLGWVRLWFTELFGGVLVGSGWAAFGAVRTGA